MLAFSIHFKIKILKHSEVTTGFWQEMGSQKDTEIRRAFVMVEESIQSVQCDLPIRYFFKVSERRWMI
jgi:hypothetical protein